MDPVCKIGSVLTKTFRTDFVSNTQFVTISNYYQTLTLRNMSLAFRVYLQLNNEAVASLSRNDHHTCGKLLNQGVTAMTESTPSARREIASVTNDCNFSLNSVTLPEIGGELALSPDGFFELCQHAFVIDNRTNYTRSPCEEDILRKLVIATMLYNMGLSYHREAVSRGNLKVMKHALAIYTAAVRVVRIGPTVVTGPTGTAFLILSLINNMGHIYSHLFDFQHAFECRSLMRNLIDDPSIVDDQCTPYDCTYEYAV